MGPDDTTDERRKALRVIQAQLNSSAKLDPESLRALLEHQRLLVATEPRSLPLRPETRDALVERLIRAMSTDADNITVPVAALREVLRASGSTREPTDEQVKAKLDEAADESFQTPDWPRAQKQGWGMPTYTGDPPPIPTYGPGSRFADESRHTGEPPSGDTPEAIAASEDQRSLWHDPPAARRRIASRIRALVVGELRAVADKVMDRANRLPQVTSQDDYYRDGNYDAARMVYGRARALESGGGE